MNAAVLPRRKVTRVAVGVLIRADGGVLLADRPVGKPYAGYWEFPGGKIEPGEDAAAALARELHEELGIDIGPSVPWVTFEFDYPHAYVELQFRRVHQWRGEPRSREGQRLRFVDPAGELPRPLLPAAVPALRWLLLPQVALVITPRDVPALADGTEGFDLATADRAARIVVLDADWRLESHSAAIAELRQATGGRHWLLAAGTGAQGAAGTYGVVLEADALNETGKSAVGWRGAWVDREEDLQIASIGGCDFVLVRSADVAEKLRSSPAALPAFLPQLRPSTRGDPGRCSEHGCWIDLRSLAAPD